MAGCLCVCLCASQTSSMLLVTLTKTLCMWCLSLSLLHTTCDDWFSCGPRRCVLLVFCTQPRKLALDVSKTKIFSISTQCFPPPRAINHARRSLCFLHALTRVIQHIFQLRVGWVDWFSIWATFWRLWNYNQMDASVGMHQRTCIREIHQRTQCAVLCCSARLCYIVAVCTVLDCTTVWETSRELLGTFSQVQLRECFSTVSSEFCTLK